MRHLLYVTSPNRPLTNYFDPKNYGATLHGRSPLARYQNFHVNPQLPSENMASGPLGKPHRRRKNPYLRYT